MISGEGSLVRMFRDQPNGDENRERFHMSLESAAPASGARLRLFVFTTGLNPHNAPVLAALLAAEQLDLAGLYLTKSFGGDRGLRVRIRRILSFGFRNVLRIGLQYIAHRLRGGGAARATGAAVRAVAAELARRRTPILRGGDWPVALEAAASTDADLVLLLYFNRIIPEAFVSKCRRIYNIHPGKLPEYRGVQVPFWVLKAREPRGFITLHEVEATVDTGRVVYERAVPAGGRSINDLMNALSACLAEDLPGLLQELCRGERAASVQDERKAVFHKRPTAADVTAFLRAGGRYF